MTFFFIISDQFFPEFYKKVNEFITAMIPTGKSKIILDKNMTPIKDLDSFVAGEKYLILTPYGNYLITIIIIITILNKYSIINSILKKNR